MDKISDAWYNKEIKFTKERTMTNSVEIGGLRVDKVLYDLVQNEIAPGTGIEPDEFWASLGELVKDLAPKNRELLEKRDALQEQIDQWYLARKVNRSIAKRMRHS
jgi:malate synthase